MKTNLRILSGNNLTGTLQIPADKSITHRALIIASISDSEVLLNNWLQSADCINTQRALQAMGVNITAIDAQQLKINGVGLHGLQAPNKVIDVGNSGTAMRLLTGILCAQNFCSMITGDTSLCKRPMQRVIAPLRLMGANITAVADNFAPLNIQPVSRLTSIQYTLPIASAQVKSAVLLADLYAQRRAEVVELVPARNHTELMLQYFQNQHAKYLELQIPGDLSSAAFFIVAATITPGSDLLLQNIGINPTRTGCLEILRLMGANITISDICNHNLELSATIRVKFAKLYGVTVPQELVPSAIDEFPILAIAAACASGTTIIRGATELRYKESDRINAIAAGLTNLGISTSVFEDGLAITGGLISGGIVDSCSDHRIAMAFAIAGLVAQEEVIVQDTQNIATSFPDFVAMAQQVGMNIVSARTVTPEEV